MLNPEELYNMLLTAYGKPRWWSEDPFVVMFQGVLVQNTNWNLVEKTCAQIGSRLAISHIENLSIQELEELIRPCGFYKAKAQTIKELLAWFRQYCFDKELVNQIPTPKLRKELLSIRGIGEETADVILVYAFYRPSFIVDAYTRRLLSRLGHTFPDNVSVKNYFEAGLPENPQIYGYFHWLILEHCISVCRKIPQCDYCCFKFNCAAFEHSQKCRKPR